MTNTIHISVQLVNPGEVAAAHRHTAAAIRFILKGNPKAYTVVQGERLPMSGG
jgi:gentisate 1,2-dioxygenase